MTAAMFWTAAVYAVIVGLVCVFATIAIFQARSLAAGATRISRSLFPPAPRDNVVDIAERRRLGSFAVQQPESVEFKNFRTQQQIRDLERLPMVSEQVH